MTIKTHKENDNVKLTLAGYGKTEQFQLSFDETKELINKLWGALMDWKEDYNSLAPGSKIYYLYRDNGEIEEGTVFSIVRNGDGIGKIVSISVDFKDDFDEFDGSALGDVLFIDKDMAKASMLGKPVLD